MAKQTFEHLIGIDEINSVKSLFQNAESNDSLSSNAPVCMTFNYGFFMIS